MIYPAIRWRACAVTLMSSLLLANSVLAQTFRQSDASSQLRQGENPTLGLAVTQGSRLTMLASLFSVRDGSERNNLPVSEWEPERSGHAHVF